MFKVRKKVSAKIKPNIINMVFFISFEYNSKEIANKNLIKDCEAFRDKLSSYPSIASIFFFNRKISSVNKKIKMEQEIAVTVQDVDVAKDIIKDFNDSKSVKVNITGFDFLNKRYIKKKLLEEAFYAANLSAQSKIAAPIVVFNRPDISECKPIYDRRTEHRHLPEGNLVTEIVDWDFIFDEDQINFDFFNLDTFNKISNLQDKLNIFDSLEKESFLKLEATYNVNYVKNYFPHRGY